MRRFSNQRGPTEYHTTLQKIQAHFGFTQQELAGVLGVSRTALTMSNKGARNLPPEAWERLLRFYHVLPKAETAALPAAPPLLLSADEREELDLRRRVMMLQAGALRSQLARSRTQVAQAQLRQAALPGLRATFPTSDELAQALFTLWERQAAATLRHEPGAAAKLTLRLATLEFEAAAIAKLLNESRGPEANLL